MYNFFLETLRNQINLYAPDTDQKIFGWSFKLTVYKKLVKNLFDFIFRIYSHDPFYLIITKLCEQP